MSTKTGSGDVIKISTSSNLVVFGTIGFVPKEQGAVARLEACSLGMQALFRSPRPAHSFVET